MFFIGKLYIITKYDLIEIQQIAPHPSPCNNKPANPKSIAELTNIPTLLPEHVKLNPLIRRISWN